MARLKSASVGDSELCVSHPCVFLYIQQEDLRQAED